MTEIRPIRADEADAFLDLLCSVFHLDPQRAQSVFYTEPLFDLQRKWALFEAREMITVLTTCPLQFGNGRAFGIAGVATHPSRQGEGNASKLLEKVFLESTKMGEGTAFLFAKDTRLYERNGYEVLDRVMRRPLVVDDVESVGTPMGFPAVQSVYDSWASQDPRRLRRDSTRWNYWQWHYRICNEFDGGYVCGEPGVLREAVFDSAHDSLPLPPNTEWFGTDEVAELLGLPFAGKGRLDLHLMGRNSLRAPLMFMTDQF